MTCCGFVELYMQDYYLVGGSDFLETCHRCEVARQPVDIKTIPLVYHLPIFETVSQVQNCPIC